MIYFTATPSEDDKVRGAESFVVEPTLLVMIMLFHCQACRSWEVDFDATSCLAAQKKVRQYLRGTRCICTAGEFFGHEVLVAKRDSSERRELWRTDGCRR